MEDADELGGSKKERSVEEYLAQGFHLVETGGSEAKPLVDSNNRVFGVYVSPPDNPTYAASHKSAYQELVDASLAAKFPAAFKQHRRGRFAAINVGLSYGQGQTTPSWLESDYPAVAERLLASTNFNRLAGFASASLGLWAPRLHGYYVDYSQKFDGFGLPRTRPFPASVFAAAAFNFRPRAWTHKHRDVLNLPFGWCAIIALGKFDDKKGGHLVLWDLKLIIEFPAGSLILIPSATLSHSNVKFQSHEMRALFTQFTAGGLFRFVDNGFRTEGRLCRRGTRGISGGASCERRPVEDGARLVEHGGGADGRALDVVEGQADPTSPAHALLRGYRAATRVHGGYRNALRRIPRPPLRFWANAPAAMMKRTTRTKGTTRTRMTKGTWMKTRQNIWADRRRKRRRYYGAENTSAARQQRHREAEARYQQRNAKVCSARSSAWNKAQRDAVIRLGGPENDERLRQNRVQVKATRKKRQTISNQLVAMGFPRPARNLKMMQLEERLYAALELVSQRRGEASSKVAGSSKAQKKTKRDDDDDFDMLDESSGAEDDMPDQRPPTPPRRLSVRKPTPVNDYFNADEEDQELDAHHQTLANEEYRNQVETQIEGQIDEVLSLDELRKKTMATDKAAVDAEVEKFRTKAAAREKAKELSKKDTKKIGPPKKAKKTTQATAAKSKKKGKGKGEEPAPAPAPAPVAQRPKPRRTTRTATATSTSEPPITDPPPQTCPQEATKTGQEATQTGQPEEQPQEQQDVGGPEEPEQGGCRRTTDLRFEALSWILDRQIVARFKRKDIISSARSARALLLMKQLKKAALSAETITFAKLHKVLDDIAGIPKTAFANGDDRLLPKRAKQLAQRHGGILHRSSIKFETMLSILNARTKDKTAASGYPDRVRALVPFVQLGESNRNQDKDVDDELANLLVDFSGAGTMTSQSQLQAGPSTTTSTTKSPTTLLAEYHGKRGDTGVDLADEANKSQAEIAAVLGAGCGFGR
ncbi:hypothetical protein HMN09_00372000 [Mycena chlorophos]|uniref:Uncharacterized protein n=1 Tax=Mycena chlorophos TaxID=658473 RepID=A0A8H6TMX3_MYCCL|nr:hypothetical protein HMN09_00372000 [Mycena chlorophos]